MVGDALACALVGHLAGDYLLQTDWHCDPLLGKKKSSYRCGLHVLLYTLSVMTCTGWWLDPHWLLILLSIAIPHFVIDRTPLVSFYMTIMNQQRFRRTMDPWASILVDNSLHAVCLFLTSCLTA